MFCESFFLIINDFINHSFIATKLQNRSTAQLTESGPEVKYWNRALILPII